MSVRLGEVLLYQRAAPHFCGFHSHMYAALTPHTLLSEALLSLRCPCSRTCRLLLLLLEATVTVPCLSLCHPRPGLNGVKHAIPRPRGTANSGINVTISHRLSAHPTHLPHSPRAPPQGTARDRQPRGSAQTPPMGNGQPRWEEVARRGLPRAFGARSILGGHRHVPLVHLILKRAPWARTRGFIIVLTSWHRITDCPLCR